MRTYKPETERFLKSEWSTDMITALKDILTQLTQSVKEQPTAPTIERPLEQQQTEELQSILPTLTRIAKDTFSDYVVFSLFTGEPPRFVRDVAVKGQHSTEIPDEDASFQVPLVFRPPIDEALHSWGRKFFPEGYPSAERESDAGHNFNLWIREKGWFPLTLLNQGEPVCGLICLIKGTHSDGDDESIEPYSAEEILASFLKTQCEFSRLLGDELMHPQFLTAVKAFDLISEANNMEGLLRGISQCLVSNYGFGWQEFLIFEEVTKRSNVFRCRLARGQLQSPIKSKRLLKQVSSLIRDDSAIQDDHLYNLIRSDESLSDITISDQLLQKMFDIDNFERFSCSEVGRCPFLLPTANFFFVDQHPLFQSFETVEEDNPHNLTNESYLALKIQNHRYLVILRGSDSTTMIPHLRLLSSLFLYWAAEVAGDWAAEVAGDWEF